MHDTDRRIHQTGPYVPAQAAGCVLSLLSACPKTRRLARKTRPSCTPRRAALVPPVAAMISRGVHTPFTCANDRYRTDTRHGHPHGAGQARGSVLPAPLVTRADTGDTLWLEYVAGAQDMLYWLMWYDATGRPRVTYSAVMDHPNLCIMLRALGYGHALPPAS
ncbi:hypothetical protein [Komagataeibacter oboediens]